MTFVEFLIFALGSAGLTIIIVLGSIMEPVRAAISGYSDYASKLINCTMCTGFWVGMVSSLFFDINPIYAGSITSLISWSIATIVDSFSTLSFYIDSFIEDGEDNE